MLFHDIRNVIIFEFRINITDTNQIFLPLTVYSRMPEQSRTIGQSNLTRGRIAAAHGRFNGIRQKKRARVYPHQIILSCAHPSPNPKRHLDRFSRFCTAYGSESLYFTTGRPFFPLKLPHPWVSRPCLVP